jgi:ATP-dependent Lon protease
MPENKNGREAFFKPSELNVIPTVDVVVFPKMVVPLLVLDDKIISGINQASQKGEEVLLVAAKVCSDTYNGPIGTGDLYKVGTVAKIMRVMSLSDGSVKILIQGQYRVNIEQIKSKSGILKAEVTERLFSFNEDDKIAVDLKAKEVLSIIEQLGKFMGEYGREFQVLAAQVQDPERFVDFVLSQMGAPVDRMQSLLEQQSVLTLLEEVKNLFGFELESEQARREGLHADQSLSKNKNFTFRERLKNIKKDNEEEDNELDLLRRKLEDLPLSKEAKEETERQLRRLEKTSADSLEAAVIRNHLDWLLGMPWGIFTPDSCDLVKTKNTLDKDHYGLTNVKERILDHLSVKAFNSNHNAPILCFAGPPGVGKTSLGKSIAKALGRNFQRIALGGVYDESELRGHRRTYVGALPGRIIQSLKKAGSMNCVLMIDELDKLGASGRGDPSAALLEVLDPEQNGTFYDNYLGVPFDLSAVMFIATANDASAIPHALRDRMEIIELTGYSDEEKLKICRNYLVDKVLTNYGLEQEGFQVNDAVLKVMIHSYTRESGVRELERVVQKVCAKFARALVETGKKVKFTSANICEYLGNRKFALDEFDKVNRIGVANGLAYTAYGGEILQVESILMPGNGKLLLTGQLGDVMKESAQAAMSYARSHFKRFGISAKLFRDYDVHIHLPAGAIPKDGPSAGITVLSSILSALTMRPIDGSCAMTGELNLQGLVLPIGGVREKLLAAQRHGMQNVLLPEKNKSDVQNGFLNLKDLDISFYSNVDDVLDKVLMPRDFKAKPA